MGDRVNASIEIGGTMPVADIDDLLAALSYDDLSTEWDGAPVERQDIVAGQVLWLCASQVNGGILTKTEALCRERGLAYARQSDACAGAFCAERAVFRGDGAHVEGEAPVDYYETTEDEQVVLTEPGVRRLGNYEAILAWFAKANWAVPPLVFADTLDVTSTPRMPAIADPE